MNTLNRFKACLAAATFVALPILSNGCSAVTDASGAVCCTEFKAGAVIDAKIGGSLEAQTAVQAVADFSGIASAGIDDITTACRGIATDLDADKAKGDSAEANTDKQAKMKAWCDLAVSTIATIKGKAGGTLKLVLVPPQCSVNVSAKANCSAKCSGDASCTAMATLPKCTDGTLQVSCQGTCSAKAMAPSVHCEGSCKGNCQGSCTAEGGVECTGKCDGTCAASAMGGTGTGIQADGTCKGSCKGTCSVTPPGVSCSGSCNGSCSATCEATPGGAAVKCDGDCKGDVKPLKCEGGKLEGGCMVSAKCDANCDASISAKAECTPPSVTIELAGSADIQFAGKLKATLEANLPLIFEFKERLKGLATLTATITGSAEAVVDIKAACIIQVGLAAVAAVSDVAAAGSATLSVVGSVGGT